MASGTFHYPSTYYIKYTYLVNYLTLLNISNVELISKYVPKVLYKFACLIVQYNNTHSLSMYIQKRKKSQNIYLKSNTMDTMDSIIINNLAT